MESLLSYLEWLLGKWHQNNIHSITREDFIQLEKLYLAARSHDSEVEHAVLEFSEAMNAPRGDAADKRRSAALKLLRKKHADILTQREARRNDGRITTN